MNFDNGHRQLEGKYFTYVDDPKIHTVRSGRAGQAGMVSNHCVQNFGSAEFFYVVGWLGLYGPEVIPMYITVKKLLVSVSLLEILFITFKFIVTVLLNPSYLSCYFQRNGPRGIPSGGIIITVDGTNFDVIKEPKMYVVYKEKEFSSVSVYPVVKPTNHSLSSRERKGIFWQCW